MPDKAKIFRSIVTVLGATHLFVVVIQLHITDPARFLVYLAATVLLSSFRLSLHPRKLGFPLGMPFFLLAIVELQTSEAILIGCCMSLAAGVSALRAEAAREGVLISVAVETTAIGTVCICMDPLLPAVLDTAAMRILVATSTLFVSITFPAAIQQRFREEKRLGQIWKDGHFWTFPYYLVSGAVALIIQPGRSSLAWESTLMLLPASLLTYRYYRSQKAETQLRQRHAEEMAALHLRTVESLALAIEAKENLNTRGHLRRVQTYALGIGKAMGLSGEELDALRAAALLHDIGKLAIPDYILTKPGKLTPEEFAKVKVHPTVGAEIVERVCFPYPVAPIVKAHHERWDGSGYPLGLKREEIPLGARILSVVDCLDALSSDREYRKATPIEEAVRRVASGAGTSFDPKVITVLRRIYPQLEAEARNQGTLPPLSRNAVIENGVAPAAGLDLCGLPIGLPALAASLNGFSAANEVCFAPGADGADSATESGAILSRLAQSLRAMLPCDALAFFVLRDSCLKAEFAVGCGCLMLSAMKIPRGEGLTGWVAENLQPVVNGNPAVDPGFDSGAEPLLSALSLPLMGREGLFAVVNLYRSCPDGFTRRDLRFMMNVVPLISGALEDVVRRGNSEPDAKLFPLNRILGKPELLRFVDEDLLRGRGANRRVAVVMARIAGFEELILEFGIAEANRFLDELAALLKKDCRTSDLIGRIEPDTFVLVFPVRQKSGLPSRLARLKLLVPAAGSRVFGKLVSFELGDACFPDDGQSAVDLIQLAQSRLTQGDKHVEASLQSLDRELSRPAEEETLIQAHSAGTSK